jgi:hypothetical protein
MRSNDRRELGSRMLWTIVRTSSARYRRDRISRLMPSRLIRAIACTRRYTR